MEKMKLPKQSGPIPASMVPPANPQPSQEQIAQKRAEAERERKSITGEETLAFSKTDPDLLSFNPAVGFKNRWLSDNFLREYKKIKEGQGVSIGSIFRVVIPKDKDDMREITDIVDAGAAYIGYFKTMVPLKSVSELTAYLSSSVPVQSIRGSCRLLFMFGDRELIDDDRVFSRAMNELAEVVLKASDSLRGKAQGDFKEIK